MEMNPPKLIQLGTLADSLGISISDLLILARDNEIGISIVLNEPQRIIKEIRYWLTPPNCEDGLFKNFTETRGSAKERSKGDKIRGVFDIGNEVINELLVYGDTKIINIYDNPAQSYREQQGGFSLHGYKASFPISINQSDLIITEKESKKIMDLFEPEIKTTQTNVTKKLGETNKRRLENLKDFILYLPPVSG